MSNLVIKTLEEYKKKHGNHCPFCDSDNVNTDGDFREYDKEDGIILEREMDCYNPKCRKEWTEVFSLVCIK